MGKKWSLQKKIIPYRDPPIGSFFGPYVGRALPTDTNGETYKKNVAPTSKVPTLFFGGDPTIKANSLRLWLGVPTKYDPTRPTRRHLY